MNPQTCSPVDKLQGDIVSKESWSLLCTLPCVRLTVVHSQKSSLDASDYDEACRIKFEEFCLDSVFYEESYALLKAIMIYLEHQCVRFWFEKCNFM